MSGPVGSQQWMYSSGFYPHKIDNSVRFDNTGHLDRTPSSTGNMRTWTFSAWVKRSSISDSGYNCIWGAGTGGVNRDILYFDPSDRLLWDGYTGSAYDWQYISTQKFRDTSAWYHIVVAQDTNQETYSNRVKIYVNGEQITAWDDDDPAPDRYKQGYVNNTNKHTIGATVYDTAYFDGYISEVNFVDGTALTPASFGETKADTWIPKKYTGSYGTNGYYLPFNDAGFLGKDASTVLGSELVTNGTFDTNINSWTAHNGATLALSNNRLSVYESPGFDAGAYQAISVESGKTYSIEATVDKGTTNGARLSVEYTLGGRDGVETSSNTGGHFQFTFTSSSTGTVYVRCFLQAPGTAYFDNISVKEITTQGNDFTSTDVLVTDQMPDSPTNNWATLNALATPDNSANVSFSQGNLRVDNPASNYGWGDGTIPLPKTGKWVFEVLFLKTPTGASPWCYNSIGVLTNTQWGSYATDGSIFYGIDDSGGTNRDFVEAGTAQGTHAGFPAGTIVQVFADRDNNQLTFSINGTLQTQTDSTVDIPAGVDLVPATGNYEYINIINFGQDSSFAGEKTAQGNTDANGRGDFHYAPPAGYLALCTANLPDPAAAVNPAVNNSPQDHFNTVLYTGNAGTQSITGVGFQPDVVWVKKRSTGGYHGLTDAVRGTNKLIYPNATNAEITFTGGIGSFDSDGFSLASSDGTFNAAETYVSWNWKAGGSGVSNSDGTITSTVSANTDAGFSIVSFDASSSGTVGHGLSLAPQLVIQKSRNLSSDNYWWTGTTALDGSMDYLKLNDTDAKVDSGYSVPTSSVFNAVTFSNGTNQIAYCFHSVEGFSKLGSFTGNGSADGPFIYTGFRPAWVLLKNTNDTEWWTLVDNKRLGYNETNSVLSPNDSNAEYSNSGGGFDLASNGFKVRGNSNNFNGSSDTIFYMAFAEMPFKYANAR